MALAVGNLDGNATDDEIVFAPLQDPVDKNSNPARPTLRVLKVTTGGSGTSFQELDSLALSGPGDMAPFGVCGIAIADFGTGSARKVYLVVTTVNGELLVYEWDLATKKIGALRYSKILEGAVGAYNSIVVKDLAPVDGTPELYIATSRGIRKWLF